MKEFTINITQEHIDKARELLEISKDHYCNKCPNGLAIREIPEFKNCWAGPEYFGTKASFLLKFPNHVISFMNDFDMKKQVSPISYTLCFTEEQLNDIAIS